MNKQNVNYPHKEVLFNHKKERNHDSCYNFEEPCKCSAKVKEARYKTAQLKKKKKLLDSIEMK